MLETFRGFALAEVLEHEHAVQDHRGRVDLVLSLVFRRRSVRRLEDRRRRADVGAGSYAETANHAGGEIAQDVAVQVGEDEDVPLFRPLDEAHACRVDEVLPRIDVGIFLRDLTEDMQEQAVGVFHDVGLGHAVHALAAIVARVFEAVANDALGTELAHRLDRNAGAVADRLVLAGPGEEGDDFFCVFAVRLVLDAGVEVFGVLAYDHDVDVVETGAYAAIGLARAQAGQEIELVAQRDVDGPKAGTDRRCDRALDGDAIAAHRVDGLLRKRCASRLHDVYAGFLDVPVEGRPDRRGGRFQDTSSRLGKLRSGAVAGDQRHAVGRA